MTEYRSTTRWLALIVAVCCVNTRADASTTAQKPGPLVSVPIEFAIASRESPVVNGLMSAFAVETEFVLQRQVQDWNADVVAPRTQSLSRSVAQDGASSGLIVWIDFSETTPRPTRRPSNLMKVPIACDVYQRV